MARVHPLIVLQARAEARAYLFREGCYQDLDDAFMPLYEHAQRSGLIKQIGTDGIDALILAAMEKIKR